MKSATTNETKKVLPLPTKKTAKAEDIKTKPVQRKAVQGLAPMQSRPSVDVKEFGAKALIGAVIFLSVFLLGVAVITLRGEAPHAAEISLPPVIEAVNTVPVETAPRVPKEIAVPTAPVLPQGIVTVPEIKLRSKHAFDAKSVGAKLRKGEKVSIQHLYTPEVGPSWIQVKRASGQAGWVLASTVLQKKERR